MENKFLILTQTRNLPFFHWRGNRHLHSWNYCHVSLNSQLKRQQTWRILFLLCKSSSIPPGSSRRLLPPYLSWRCRWGGRRRGRCSPPTCWIYRWSSPGRWWRWFRTPAAHKKWMVTKTAKPKPGSWIHTRRQYSMLVLTFITWHVRRVGGHGLSEAFPAHPPLSLLSQLRPQMHAKYPWSGPLTVAASVREFKRHLRKQIRRLFKFDRTGSGNGCLSFV